MMEVEYLDPSLRHDPLPMPYRLIDKLLTNIIERTFESIYLKRKVTAQQSLPPAPSVTLSTDRDLVFDVEVSVTALSPDGKFVFSGGSQGEIFCHSLLSLPLSFTQTDSWEGSTRGGDTKRERKKVRVSGEKITPHSSGPVKCIAIASRKDDLVVGSSAGASLALHTYEPLGPSGSVFKLTCSSELPFPIQSLSLSPDASLLCVSLVDDELIIYAILSSPATLVTRENWHLTSLISIRPPSLTSPCVYLYPPSTSLSLPNPLQKTDQSPAKEKISKDKSKPSSAALHLPTGNRGKSRTSSSLQSSSVNPGGKAEDPKEAPIKSPKTNRKNSMVLPNMLIPPASIPISCQSPSVHFLFSAVHGEFVVCGICVWWITHNILTFYPISPFSPTSADPPPPIKSARHSFALSSSITCSCSSPDSTCLVTGLADGSVIFWNIKSGVLSIGSTSVEGHTGKVTCTCAVDRWLVSAGADGSVHTYEIPTGRLVSRFVMPQGTVEHMAPLPGGKGVMCVCTGIESSKKGGSGVMACALSLPILQIIATVDGAINLLQRPPVISGSTVLLQGKYFLPPVPLLRTSSSFEKIEVENSEDTALLNANSVLVFDVSSKLPSGSVPSHHHQPPEFTNFISLFNASTLERYRITQQKWTNIKQALSA